MGGDMYEQRRKFIDFVASRSLTRIEQWAETLTCPIISIDGTIDWCINAANIAEKFYKRNSVNNSYYFGLEDGAMENKDV
jgi:hypothetical protein